MQLMQTQGVEPEREFGSYLRTERELRQIPLSEVSAATKIPLHALENLEAGRWKDLPNEVFVRGFVRSFARHVGFSEQEASKQFDEARAAWQHPPSVPLVDDLDEKRVSSSAGRGRFELALFVIIVLILATITLSLLWRGGEANSARAGNDNHPSGTEMRV
jgi:cytoskeletal protein RodZ